MPPIENPRLRFLSDAAQLLTVHSPSISAHLLAAQTHILHEDLRPLNVRQKKHHCGACGSIRQDQTSRITEVKSKGKFRASKSESTGGAKVYKCLRCHQRTVLPRKRTTSKPLPRASTTTASSMVSGTSSEPTPFEAPLQQQNSLSADSEPQPGKAAENASSKKRAKARKQGGLQALLASKQRSQPSLDLFDFLQ